MPFYFAYGSNLLRSRLQARIGAWGKTHRVSKPNSALIFACSYSGHTSGKATIVARRGSTIHGIIVSVTKEQLYQLDKYEGVDLGAYVRRMLWVRLRNNKRKKAVGYVMPQIICLERPTDQYLGYILNGLKDWGFSEKVITAVQKTADEMR